MTIAYEGRGTEGPALLLVHGFPVDRAMWRGQLEQLSTMARVVAIDLPGFGASPALGDGRTPVGMDQLAAQVIAVADALGFARFVLGGLSMGGYVALAVHRAYPARLSGLALCDTRAEADAPEAAAQRRSDADRVLREGTSFMVAGAVEKALSPTTRSTHAEIVDAVDLMIRRSAPAGVAGILRGMADRPDARAELRGIAVPTLVVVGADDAITPPEGARVMAAAIPGAELAVIPKAGHLSPLEAPDAVNTAFRKLLRRADRP